ncbi:F390 synthetase-related protein [Paenibacillus bouchesdurhonensis]|uniref:F390 synthetase-related protein n=1 Tax=Paenibacillus bouchesdurhonensis TaxID=1870990 RepID=UPI000DA63CD4|nr:F390 synthetase-related protein [Paenibacillus bouchesdurhonensis]
MLIDKGAIVYHYLRTKFRQWPASRQGVEQWQEERVRSHVRFVRKHSAFYRELWKDYTDAQWRQFPIMDKELMMEHFDPLNTVGITKEEAFAVAYQAENSRDFAPTIGSITVGLSSGTSGNRGIFLVSPQERRAWAGTVLAKMLPNSLLQKESIAFFLRANSNLYGSVGSNRLQFHYYDLLSPVQEHIERLNEQRPGLIVAPPSMLRILAQARQQGNLRINPHKIISVAEVLDPLDRKPIETQFEQRVHQVYQCTEGFLACTCSHGTLHLNEDIVIIEKEYLDRKLGRFVPIITDFSRRTQPIVRYRLNDVLTERAEPCPCGSPFLALESIEGRCDDIFYGYSLHDNRLKPIFPDFISRAIIHASEQVLEYLAIQHTPDRVEIFLRVDEAGSRSAQIEEHITHAMNDLLLKMNCKPPTIEFSVYDQDVYARYDKQGELTELKKLRRVERRFQLGEDTDPFI